MLKKIKGSMILMQWAFLLIVVGGSSLIFSLFATDYYIAQKSKIMRVAFEEIKQSDLKSMDSEDKRVLKSYEDEENFVFIITDEKQRPLYMSRKYNATSQIYKNVTARLDDYSSTPRVRRNMSKLMGIVRFPGIIEQEGRTYYVCIKEEIKSAYSSFKYTQSFLVLVIVVALLVGSIIMYILSTRITKPIGEIGEVAKRVAKRDFTKKARTNSAYQEINDLADNVNAMSDQIQDYVLRLEVDKDRLEAVNSQQEKMDEVRKEFMANISHELKTPLTVISSQVEMLQCMGDEIDRDYYYGSIVEEISKMSEMIGNMLNLTVAEHHMDTMEKSRVDLSEMLGYLMLKYDALFRQNSLNCKTEIEPKCGVLGNRVFLEQAVGNYLMNAFRHTPQGGLIRVTLNRDDGFVFIRVFNEGKQITEMDMDKIWKSFYMKGGKEIEQEEEKSMNAGLGLYIVRSIIGLHHGECGADNKETGVEFWIKLPAI